MNVFRQRQERETDLLQAEKQEPRDQNIWMQLKPHRIEKKHRKLIVEGRTKFEISQIRRTENKTSDRCEISLSLF